MSPSTPRPSSSRIFGNCVVFPEPVSPQTITTWCLAIACAMSARRALTGSSSGVLRLRQRGAALLELGRRVAVLLRIHAPAVGLPGFNLAHSTGSGGAAWAVIRAIRPRRSFSQAEKAKHGSSPGRGAI
jgi:hypothetical protein